MTVVLRCQRWGEPERLVQIEGNARSFSEAVIFKVRDIMTGELLEVAGRDLDRINPLNEMEVLAWAASH